MPKNKVKRTRKGTNLYLSPALVTWAKEHAQRKFGITLSALVERRLRRMQADCK